MKTKFMTIAICALLLFAAGCKDNNQPSTDPKSIAGNIEKPSWAAPTDYDMTASMTAIVKVDLAKTYPVEVANDKWQITEGDLLAAFSGEKCLGVDTLNADLSGLFFLYISGQNGDNNEDVQLRYYSTTLKNIFVSKELIPFSNDAELGSVSAPYSPEFAVKE